MLPAPGFHHLHPNSVDPDAARDFSDLDAWLAKLRAGGVGFLEAPSRLGDTRAVTIEGPSREAVELLEVGGAL